MRHQTVLRKNIFFLLALSLFIISAMTAGTAYAVSDINIDRQMNITNETEWNNANIRFTSSDNISPVITVGNGGILKLTEQSVLNLGTFGDRTAIRVESGGQLIIDQSTISGANGSNPEAFIVVNGGELILRNGASLQDCANTGETGSVVRIADGKFTIDGAAIKNCSSYYTGDDHFGGIVFAAKTAVSISGAVLEQNKNCHGGVITADNAPSFKVTDTNADRNQNEEYGYSGGTFFTMGTPVNIGENVQFINNIDIKEIEEQDVYYTGISVINGSLTIADGARFEKMKSDYGGGAVHGENAEITIGAAVFDSNFSYSQGPAILLTDGSMTLNGSIFSNNRNRWADCGAVLVEGENETVLRIIDATFRGNNGGSRGGALKIGNNGVAYIEKALFEDNITRGFSGGALFIDINGRAEMKLAAFLNNYALGQGGALVLYGTSVNPGMINFIGDRNGAAIIGSSADYTQGSGLQDIYLAYENWDETMVISERMFNGGHHNWESAVFQVPVGTSDWGTYIGGHPSNEDISGARVIFRNNRADDGDANGWGGAIFNLGQMIIGEEGTSFHVVKNWKNDSAYPIDRPSVPELLEALQVFTNGTLYPLGEPKLLEEEVLQDGTTRYLYNFSEDISVSASVTVSDKDSLDFLIEGLPKFIDGAEVSYTVDEKVDPEYTYEVSGNMTEGFVITNTFNPFIPPLTINTIWEDNGDQNKDRPTPKAYLTKLILKADEETLETGEIVLVEKRSEDDGTDIYVFSAENDPELIITLTDAHNGIYRIVIENLKKFVNGTRVNYTIDQQPLFQYKTDIDGNMTDGFTIVNTWYSEGNKMTFYRLSPALRELPATGFSASKPGGLSKRPMDLRYSATDLTLSIPSIGVSAPIVTVPFSGEEYPVEWLEEQAGALEGFDLPAAGTSILTGHNHLNSAEAGPFAMLRYLAEGDRIFVTDSKGRMHSFTVYTSEKIAADDISKLEEIINRYEGSLTLLTCEDERPEGGYASRRVVSAK